MLNGYALHQQGEPKPDDIEQRHESDDIEDRHLQAAPEQRIAHHPLVIVQPDEGVLAEAADLEEAETQRQNHRPADEDQQPDGVGRNEQIARDPFARDDSTAAVRGRSRAPCDGRPAEFRLYDPASEDRRALVAGEERVDLIGRGLGGLAGSWPFSWQAWMASEIAL